MGPHIAQITETRRVRDLFLRYWWVSCGICGFSRGPYRLRWAAESAHDYLDSIDNCPRR